MPRWKQKVLPASYDGDLQGAEGLRVHYPAENIWRGLLQGQVSAPVQSGAPSRAPAEPHLEGEQTESAAALLRAQQARRAGNPLLWRERLHQTQNLELEKHEGPRVLLLLNQPILSRLESNKF